MGFSHGHHWSNADIQETLTQYARTLGRMPSNSELAREGRTDLCCVISRRGGFAHWAKVIGFPQKGTETHRGLAIQSQMVEWFRDKLGFKVQEQTTKALYDILVEGLLRVDVKAARRYKDGGHVFGISKSIPTCDLYALCGLDGDDRILWRYFVPAHRATVRTLTITPEGKYSSYKENVEIIHRIIENLKELQEI